MIRENLSPCGWTASGWTAAEIAARSGLSTAVFEDRRLGAREIAQLAETGIRHLELDVLPLDLSALPRSVDHRDAAQMSEIKAACETNDIRMVSIHSPNLAYGSSDERLRLSAVREGLFLAHLAAGMGARLLVNHFRVDDQTRKSIRGLLDGIADLPLVLGAENLTDENSIKKIRSLVEEFDSDQLGMVLDIGHETDDDGVNPFTAAGRARCAVTQCRGRLVHVHLHETLAFPHKCGAAGLPSPRHRDHQPPLHEDGMIQWGGVFQGLRDIDYAGILLFEDGLCDDPWSFVEATISFPGEFVRRYQSL